ncbi:hypothetical protein BO91_00665 [Candidatus Synechococcus spongiarum LMB bulk10E]|uniref:Uncharacterized protein n=2 Tax=Candidatus Synechococcus spongiarum TaxID=431041 RepID=A0A1T1C9U3_9SYNE|nr:MAG: hypothetical protein TQ37_03665 [Candidatus Synechococcus spongiarum 15L]OOV25386.1 hypothetical protein BV61_06890 [Candidatus Synechococcus spongiarum LMB bulk15M]OOV35092.1 hypothetical protein BO91_00665 [Candidatus Synechococcus spongiarum LMB bulk10E]
MEAIHSHPWARQLTPLAGAGKQAWLPQHQQLRGWSNWADFQLGESVGETLETIKTRPFASSPASPVIHTKAEIHYQPVINKEPGRSGTGGQFPDGYGG